jgi:DNA-directed RNA polymerase specialized sigma subunit
MLDLGKLLRTIDGTTYRYYTKGVDSMELYHDLCIEIDIITIRIKNLESEYKYWLMACHDSTINRAFPLDTCLNRMENICNKVEEYTTVLEEKERTRREIEQRMNEFEGLEQKVAYMRDVKDMTLPEIAADLGYSYIWIKKISARAKKNYTKNILTY